MYYTSNTPGLQVSLALPRFVCPHTPPVGFPVFARFLCLSGFGYAPLFARFSHRECVRSLCALPQALHTSTINPLPTLFSFSRACLFINRPLPQHKTPFLHVRKISTVNQIHQSVSPGFGPAPLLHPASALVRCFAHCFCPGAMHFHFRILYITNLFGKAMANDSPSGRHLSLFSALFAHSFKAFLAPFSFRSFLPQVPRRQLHTIRICSGRSVSPLQAAFQAKRFSLCTHVRSAKPRSLCRIISSCRCQSRLSSHCIAPGFLCFHLCPWQIF